MPDSVLSPLHVINSFDPLDNPIKVNTNITRFTNEESNKLSKWLKRQSQYLNPGRLNPEPSFLLYSILNS